MVQVHEGDKDGRICVIIVEKTAFYAVTHVYVTGRHPPVTLQINYKRLKISFLCYNEKRRTKLLLNQTEQSQIIIILTPNSKRLLGSLQIET